jgi:transcriptional regulator with XRE-family HTH domain
MLCGMPNAAFRSRCINAVLRERRSLGLSQVELASRTGLAPQYINDFERGARNVGLDNLEKMLRGLRIVVNPTSPTLRQQLAVTVRHLRDLHGISQAALASKAGLHRTYVSMLERTVKSISLDSVERLAEALDVAEEDLLGIRWPV